jgi:hypothetical protein
MKKILITIGAFILAVAIMFVINLAMHRIFNKPMQHNHVVHQTDQINRYTKEYSNLFIEWSFIIDSYDYYHGFRHNVPKDSTQYLTARMTLK